ncbi:MerR family transcriptional regulator [Mycolicibacterium sp. 018/SC-01/001]|uniref:MerR family transcriptional regulator n=1 Tax=Mycolicibacterium sp. 018/SC-01/001 TaxID=2592069 RepID=UPI00118045C6|nr:MerR family transcriptional regulator [Mycolicibacterium sp. 018/SC-01/001]TRW89138.1 MerR family transcriptional regulator [Mycolicibacterium sp. 018/SC-01/001]
MLIGELARRAGVSTRQVRFYEANSLITSVRAANNYRVYDEVALGRVKQIRELLDAGLSIQLIRAILPCLQSPREPIVFYGVLPETVAILEHQRDRLTERIDVLTRNRDAVTAYLAELQRRAHGDDRSAPDAGDEALPGSERDTFTLARGESRAV